MSYSTKLKTTEQFIDHSRRVHGDKYNYSKVNYINNETEVTIICPEHGEFKQQPKIHLHNHGCVICGIKLRTLTLEQFIQKSNSIHSNKYDYSKVNYVDSNTEVTIICPKHGEFNQIPKYHYSNGVGCKKCKLEYHKLRDTLENFIEKAKKVHNCTYDYSKVNYIDSKTKVIIICSEHGEFKQRPALHLFGSGCPVCKYSRGEREVYTYLKEHNIEFITQKEFDDCRGKFFPLVFDFYIHSKNLLIEYDGEQHYNYISGLHGNKDRFYQYQLYDQIKNEYALKNNIKLIRIRYDESIEDRLKDIL